MANHDQLLADTVYRQFEIPLLSALDHYKLITADRLASYEQRLSEQSARIRKTEAENLRGGRRRKRDLDSFRLALAELQRQVDELDGIKAGYHEEVLEEEDEVGPLLCPGSQGHSRQVANEIDLGHCSRQSSICRQVSTRLLREDRRQSKRFHTRTTRLLGTGSVRLIRAAKRRRTDIQRARSVSYHF